MKWEDKHLGRKFMVVDHKGLEYFKTQPNWSPRQTRWWEYLSRFNYNTIHIDGTWNQVADSMSHYYEYGTIEDEYPNSEFVKTDEILDPDRDLAPIQQFVEIWNQAIRRLQRLQERTPTARLESQMLTVEQETEDKDTIIYTAGSNRKPLHIDQKRIQSKSNDNEIFFFFAKEGNLLSRHSVI